MTFYLAREGVAFGPYTEFQVRESVRIGIFESADLALAENSTEWSTIAGLLAAQQPISGQGLAESRTATPFTPTRLNEPRLRIIEHIAGRQLPFAWWKLPLAVSAVAVALCIAGLWGRQRGAFVHVAKQNTAVQTAGPAAQSPVVQPAAPPVIVAKPMQPTTPAVTKAVATPEPPLKPVADPAVEDSASKESVVTPPEPTPAAPVPHREIEGQIFIAAKNGINYEPSSVEVRLYPLALLKPYLEKRGVEAGARFEELKKQILAAEAQKDQSRKAADLAFDAYVRGGAENRRALEQASSDARRGREEAANAYYGLLQEREDLLSGDFYLKDLPPSVAKTMTDMQGRFTFDVPPDGEFAVVAGAQRGSDDSAERFYWFVPVSSDGEPRKKVLLSNNNMSSHGSADSLVLTAD